MKNLIKNRIIVRVLIFVLAVTMVLPMVSFRTAQAQSIPVDDPLAVPTKDRVQNATLGQINSGIGSDVLGQGLNIFQNVASEVGESCQEYIQDFSSVSSLNSFLEGLGNSSFAAIGGSEAESVQIAEQLATLKVAQACISKYVAALSRLSTPNLIAGNQIQRQQQTYNEVDVAMQKKITDLEARLSASWKDVLRAVMVKVLLNLNQNITTKLVNNMVQKYKIDDYLAYGDAVATQVYSMKYINENYQGDARTQMMLRSLIQSEKVPDQARVAAKFANTKAKEYIKNNCNNISTTGIAGPTGYDFYNCLASYGSEQASPYFQYLNALDQASEVKAAGQASAKQEIDSSNGFAPPRDCSGSVEQQRQIDAKYQQAAAEVEAAEAVYLRLETAFWNGGTTKEEVDKAKAALAAAEKKLEDLPTQGDQTVIDICKAIDSPGAFVGNQLTEYISQYLDQSSNLKSDNLPFYADFISNVASNFLTNLITGGKSSSKVLKEAGLNAIAPAAVDVAGIITNNTTNNSTGTVFSNNGVVVTLTNPGSSSPINNLQSGRTYTINIDFTEYLRSNPAERIASITVRDRDAGQLASSNLQISTQAPVARFDITAPARRSASGSSEERVIFVDLFDGGGGDAGYVGVGYQLSGAAGTVGGVSTLAHPTLPRGPMPVFSAR